MEDAPVSRQVAAGQGMTRRAGILGEPMALDVRWNRSHHSFRESHNICSHRVWLLLIGTPPRGLIGPNGCIFSQQDVDRKPLRWLWRWPSALLGCQSKLS